MTNRQQYQQQKESTSIVLLLILFIVLLQPITPLCTDALAHKYFAAAHEQMHLFGKQHLDNDLKNSTSQDSNLPKNNSSIIIDLLLDFVPQMELSCYEKSILLAIPLAHVANSFPTYTLEIQPPDIS